MIFCLITLISLEVECHGLIDAVTKVNLLMDTFTGKIMFAVDFKVVSQYEKHSDIREVYRRDTIYKNVYCKSKIILFIWLIGFFRCSVIFMWKPTGIAALNFLPRTFKFYKEKVLCLHHLKRWKPDRTLQNNVVILFSRKFGK